MGRAFRLDHEPLEMTFVFRWLLRLAMLSWLGTTAVLVYWVFFDDTEPVIVRNISLLPEGPHRAGDTVTLHVDVCQNLPGVPGTGIRMIRGPESGGYTHFLSENYIDPSVECTRHDRPITLPRDLAPGQYQYVFQGVYQVNPVKTKVFTQPPVAFEIVK